MKKYYSIICAAFVLAVISAFGFNAGAATDIASTDITLAQTECTYTGWGVEPGVTVKDGSTVLVENTDYKLTYSGNVAVTTTAKVTVEGIGAYTGTTDKLFTIKAADISASTFKNNVRTTPGKGAPYTVTYNGKTLKENTDYKLSFSNIDKAGAKVGTAAFQGIGNFAGTKNLSIDVYPDAVSSVYFIGRKKTSITIGWKEQNVDGYQVFLCDKNGKNAKHYLTTHENSAKLGGLDVAEVYHILVRSYATNGNGTVFGEYSSVYTNATAPKKVEVKSVEKSKDKKYLKIKWKKTSCDMYRIQYSTDKSFKSNVSEVDVYGDDTTSKAVSIPKSKKHYYVRIKAGKTFGDNIAFSGEWSKKVSTDFNNLYKHYACHYPSKPARNHNLKVACKAINGTIVYPGETFSFNKTVGVRSPSKGYKLAPTYRGPHTTVPGYGGGVCQVASTVFNTALLANMQIVERHQHSQRVHYGKLGRDATVFYGSQDFKFKNTSPYPIKIKMWLQGQKVHCSFYVCQNVKPKKVTLKVSKKGKSFTLRRYVDNKVNYKTHSYY